jgi:hypothetical protein
MLAEPVLPLTKLDAAVCRFERQHAAAGADRSRYSPIHETPDDL